MTKILKTTLNNRSPKLNLNITRGATSIIASAFVFYMATFFVRMGFNHEETPVIIYVSARFILGYFLLLAWFKIRKIDIHSVKVNSKLWLWQRAIWNIIAVVFFYLGVTYGTVTGANILNMTYPAFVAFLSMIFLGEAMKLQSWFGLTFSLIGAFFISYNGLYYTPETGDLFGLLSGITAGVAITALRKIRLTDSVDIALFYVFRLGAWITGIPAIYLLSKHPDYITPNTTLFILLSALCGILGQVLLTYGYKFVRAVEGSIYSSSRLLFALAIGYYFWQKELYIQSFIGAALIFAANVLLSLNGKKVKSA